MYKKLSKEAISQVLLENLNMTNQAIYEIVELVWNSDNLPAKKVKKWTPQPEPPPGDENNRG